jgi:HK97 family phage portal protein
VELLASSVANTDWYAARFDTDAGVWQRTADQPNIVTDPDPSTDVWQFRYAVAVDLIEYGNHVSLLGDVDGATGRPGWLLPVPADLVGIVHDPGGGWWWTVAGRMFDPSEVLHISAGNESGERLGRGTVRQYADALGQVSAAERYSGKWFAGGGLPPAIMSVTPQPSASELEGFKSRWRLMSQTGEPIALPPNVTVTPLVQDADRAQLVESRTWNAQMVAMVLGIPPHMFGLPGPSMTYQNITDADIAWVRDSVDRWAQPIRHAFSKHLLPRGQELRFDWGSRMRSSPNLAADYITKLTGAGVVTVDEGRQELGFGPMPQDDTPREGTTPQGVPELVPSEVAG